MIQIAQQPVKGRPLNTAEERAARAAIEKHPEGANAHLIGAASGEGTYAYSVGGRSVLAAQTSGEGAPDVIHVDIEPFKWQMMSEELRRKTFDTVKYARQHVASVHGNEDSSRFSLDVVQLHAATKQVLQIRLRDISEQGGFVTVFLEGGEITEVAREAA